MELSRDAGAAGGPLSRDEALRLVRTTLADHLGLDVERVPADERVLDLPGVDSAKVVRWLAALERQHGVALDEGRLLAVRSPADLADLLVDAVAGRRS
ncbi:acyl carrier protein [Streptoalloteichus hindustanus]|uniref:Acyl carrier protein n=1 Tax=Streptoalloteichus hindustanus TaxID=2017 RepID=A0A1M4YRA8_STRHI|nr:acyl carrier protein [Streptoalloteichus hindustanus]SHF08042.1 Acyl carrier protein [Streptoalloteichus hindustanus]